ncbi:hypothetical protein KHQ82_05305 [Mycoplasmatota bacterium]|nr:hypothetical protein KHQ82_05305 [Mycoplasmatota bacterium]
MFVIYHKGKPMLAGHATIEDAKRIYEERNPDVVSKSKSNERTERSRKSFVGNNPRQFV